MCGGIRHRARFDGAAGAEKTRRCAPRPLLARRARAGRDGVEETLQRRIAAMMRGGELKAGEQFRAMEMLHKLEKAAGQAGKNA